MFDIIKQDKALEVKHQWFPKPSIPVQVGVGSPYTYLNLADNLPWPSLSQLGRTWPQFVGKTWGKLISQPAHILSILNSYTTTPPTTTKGNQHGKHR